MLDDGLYTRFPKPDPRARLPRQRVASGRDDRRTRPATPFANVDSVDIKVRGVGGHGAVPHATKDPIVLGVATSSAPCRPWSAARTTRRIAAVVTVGSFQAGAKHNVISDEAKLQLTVRSYKPKDAQAACSTASPASPAAKAIAAGIPEDRMPVVTCAKAQYTPAVVQHRPA